MEIVSNICIQKNIFSSIVVTKQIIDTHVIGVLNFEKICERRKSISDICTKNTSKGDIVHRSQTLSVFTSQEQKISSSKKQRSFGAFIFNAHMEAVRGASMCIEIQDTAEGITEEDTIVRRKKGNIGRRYSEMKEISFLPHSIQRPISSIEYRVKYSSRVEIFSYLLQNHHL